jgi:hypothetical protein
MSEFIGPKPACGFIGMNLDEVRQTHFFQWFNLELAVAPDAARKVFKPSGAKFHDLVTVSAQIDASQRIAMIELVVARSFIEDPREGMFAADIAKSFLEAALAPEDRAHIKHLIDTIAYGGSYAVPILAARASDGPAPETARDSAPYLVWLDKNSHWRRPFDAVLLEVQNVMTDGTKSVRLAVSAL